MPRVSVIIPAGGNRTSNIRDVLATLPDDLHEVMIVGGDSEGATFEAARELRPDVRVVGQAGTGNGDALATGLTECTGEVVVMLDADRAADGAELPRFVDELIAGAVLAKGSNVGDGGSSTDRTPRGRTRKWLFCALVSVLQSTGA
jgi:glycosyltransferase involved in cell wall biosynthesis